MICDEQLEEAALSYWNVTYKQLKGNKWEQMTLYMSEGGFVTQIKNQNHPNHAQAETAEIGMPRKGIRGKDD